MPDGTNRSVVHCHFHHHHDRENDQRHLTANECDLCYGAPERADKDEAHFPSDKTKDAQDECHDLLSLLQF